MKQEHERNTFAGVCNDVELMEDLLDIHPFPKYKHVIKYLHEVEKNEDELND